MVDANDGYKTGGCGKKMVEWFERNIQLLSFCYTQDRRPRFTIDYISPHVSFGSKLIYSGRIHGNAYAIFLITQLVIRSRTFLP